MRKGTLLLATGLASVLLALPAHAMRCGTKLVNKGDPQGKVLAVCGQPDQSETRVIYRAGLPRYSVGVRADAAGSRQELLIHDRSFVEIKVETWLFNRGPRRLMREVVFHDGRVVAINVLGYGY